VAETAISTDPRYPSRPTVRLDDQENEAVSARISTFRVTEQAGGLSSLELHLQNFADGARDRGDPEFFFEDEADVRLGTRISLYSGDENHPREIFRGVVSGLEVDFSEGTAAEVVVMAEDALQRARLARRTKVWDELRLSALAEEVAQGAGLTPRITGFSEAVGTHVQLNESDLAFLRRLLDRYDGDLQIVANDLQVSPRRDVDRGTVELALGRQLRRARFVVDLAHQVSEVTTSGWDPDRGQRVSATSQGANLGPGEGRSGATLLEEALARRSEHVGHPTVKTDAEARALADAAFDRRARRFVVLEGTAEGNPLIRVGTKLRVTSTPRRFANTYYVVHASHRYDSERGYETDFEAECAYLGNP
jgi:phage protein D